MRDRPGGGSTSGQVTVLLRGTGLEPALAGGKGAALDRLIQLGLPVPPTGVITTEAYRRFVGHGDLGEQLVTLARSGRSSDEAADIDQAFLAAPMPDDLGAEIRALAGAVRQGGLLAVRSSATAEDLAAASFAGQYRSVLEVGDDDEVERAVRLVWASLWHPAPRAYRAHAGVDEHDLAMSVVVMRLVDARRAGVVFTLDPGGDRRSVRLEAVSGLAEQLVSGGVTPDAYVVPRQRSRRRPLDPIVDEVVDTAMGIERMFGQPMDVEWAHDGEQLFIVQARPITTIAVAERSDRFDTKIGSEDTYTTAGVAEMLPGVLPPLQWTTVAPLLEEGFRNLFDRMGALPDVATSRTFLARVNGRAVLSLDLMRAAARQVPGGSAQEVERQYFGQVVSTEDEPAAARRGPFRGLRNMARGATEIAARRRFRFEAEAAVEIIRRITAEPPALAELGDDDLMAYRFRLLDLAGRAVGAEVAVAAAAAAAYRGIELFLEPHVGTTEAARAAQQLTSGGIQPCGSQLTLNTCLLTALAMVDSEVADALTQVDDIAEIRDRLSRLDAGDQLIAQFDDELERAGSAAVFAGATWAESEDLAWQLVRQSVQLERMGARDGLSRDQRIERLQEIERRFRTSVKYRVQRTMTGQLVDVRKRLLRRLVFDAVEFLDKRESTKSAVLRLGGEVRRVHLEVGRRLTERGVLDCFADVDLLDSHELADALEGRPPSRWDLEQRARVLAANHRRPPLPQVFTGDPSRSVLTKVVEGDVFTGWPASPGAYDGTARVLSGPSDPIAPGEILVARTTDPSWTPLFLTAGAIVVEEGGPLSHAAIIARELGLPAVLNVGGLIDRIGGSAARLTVDGDAGTVTIVDSEPVREDAARELAA